MTIDLTTSTYDFCIYIIVQTFIKDVFTVIPLNSTQHKINSVTSDQGYSTLVQIQ